MQVSDVFELGGRVVLAPGLDSSEPGRWVGRRITLKRPDGSRVTTMIASVELPSPNPSGLYPIAISDLLAKSDVPIGTEVWLEE